MHFTASNSDQFRIVSSFNDLVQLSFYNKTNAFCWQRNLKGDFKEIASKLQLKEAITEISVDDLLNLNLSNDGKIARDILINDIQLLTNFGASPSLNLLKCYDKDDEFDFISTDVYSYHVDRSPIATDTFLCTYFGAASDIIANEEVEKKIDIPEIRQQLLKLYDGPIEGFEEFLIDNYFDLHYQAKPNAKPINLGNGSIWRLAVDHPYQNVAPCVHRAPIENENEYRLLLIC